MSGFIEDLNSPELFGPETLAGFEGVPDWEAKRRAERQAIAEVLPFEQEKRLVNQQVRDNAAILGTADIGKFPLEATTEQDRNA